MLKHDLIVSAFASLLLCGCADDMESGAKHAGGDQPIPTGKARIYVIAGNWYAEGLALSYPKSFAVTIDGVRVGSLNTDEAMVVNVSPGHHIVAQNLIAPWGVSSETLSLDLGNVAAGERVYVAADRVAGGTEAPTSAGRDSSTRSDPPHQEPGDYLDVRADGPELIQERTIVAPDREAVAQLDRR